LYARMGDTPVAIFLAGLCIAMVVRRTRAH
jgi:hypothetical protein